MNLNKTTYDTSSDLLLKSVNNGITLVKPEIHNKNESTLLSRSVENIINLPIAVYFENLDHRTIRSNEITVEECGFTSMREFIGAHWFKAFDKNSIHVSLCNDRSVVEDNQSKIFEEKGWRKDGIYVHTLSFRMPWYGANNNIIGLFGFSIVLGKHSIADALIKIAELGFLNQSLLLQIQKKQETCQDITRASLTMRESECFNLLLKGMSAKEVGRALKISFRTVEKYQTSLLEKLNCKNKYELMYKFS